LRDSRVDDGALQLAGEPLWVAIVDQLAHRWVLLTWLAGWSSRSRPCQRHAPPLPLPPRRRPTVSRSGLISSTWSGYAWIYSVSLLPFSACSDEYNFYFIFRVVNSWFVSVVLVLTLILKKWSIKASM
jgi:hypothetical protein